MSPDYIVTSLQALYGEAVTSAEIKGWCAMNGSNYQTVTKKIEQYKTGRGKWNFEVSTETVENLEETYNAPAAMPAIEQNLIPTKDDNFVKFGNFTDIKKVIESGLFYPVFITGLSGNGKTFSVEQACAQTQRELIRVNITIETDEDDLIGGFRLVNGETVWHNGPVIEPSSGEQFCFLTKSTLPPTRSYVFSPSSKGRGFSSRKLASMLHPRRVSRSSQQQIPRVKVPTMDDSLVLMCSTKPSWKGSLSPLSKSIPLPHKRSLS